ncbi:unnamed protein product [Sphagnum jensenii]|uniref:Reverse transcriptase n=1 Tax=Sphagnum jensenii TaxID=128206 RepID=A0ABP1BFI2_9BRYO
MFVLRQLSRKAQVSSNVQLHLAFIDLAKAYDSVNREALCPGSEPLSLATIVVLLYADDMVLFSADADKFVTMLRMVDF